MSEVVKMRTARAVVLGLLVALLAGCTATGPGQHPAPEVGLPLPPPEGPQDYSKYTNYPELVRQFEAVTSDLQIPAGTHVLVPDEIPPDVGPDGQPVRFRYAPYDGWASGERAGLCLWIGEWLETRIDDAAAAGHAATQIAGFVNSWSYRYENDVSGQDNYDELIRQVQLGDPRLANQFMGAACIRYADQFDF